MISGPELWLGLPTGGKGHGGDEKDLLCCCVKRSREAYTDLLWSWKTRRYGVIAVFAEALKRGFAVYLLLYGVLKRDSRFGFLGCALN
jgi:hypothetical protein